MSRFYALVKMMLVTSNCDVIAAFKPKWLFLVIDLEILCNLFTEKNARIMLLKILAHSMAVCVTFCFDGCFVKCFQHVPLVIIPF